ncbi:hypothetical protein AAZV13_08G261900 [Glycine max]
MRILAKYNSHRNDPIQSPLRSHLLSALPHYVSGSAFNLIINHQCIEGLPISWPKMIHWTLSSLPEIWFSCYDLVVPSKSTVDPNPSVSFSHLKSIANVPATL